MTWQIFSCSGASASMTKIKTKCLKFVSRDGSVGVSDGRGNALLVPADTLIGDRTLRLLVVVDACGTGFHFDKNDFLDVLRVRAFENEKVDWRPDEFGLNLIENEGDVFVTDDDVNYYKKQRIA